MAQKDVSQRSTAGSVGSSRAIPKKKNPVKTNISVSTSVGTSGNNKLSAPTKGKNVDQRDLDISALGLSVVKTAEIGELPEVPKASLVREELLLEAQRAVMTDSMDGKKAVSIVVIGEFLFSIS